MNNNGDATMDELDKLLSMNDLIQLETEKFLVKYLQGSDRIYYLKEGQTNELLKTMSAFRKQGLFCDVSFIVHGSLVSAHKVVLASASQYFAAMFSNSNFLETKSNQPIDMANILPCTMVLDVIFDFLYTSQIHLNEKFIIPLLIISSKLLLDNLIDICVHYLHDQLHSSNCVGLLLCGKKQGCPQLTQAAQHYIYEHFEDVIRHEEFLTLNIDDFQTLIEDDKVKVECESIIYMAVMQWVRHDPVKRRPYLLKLLSFVRLALLPPAFLEKIIRGEDFAPAEMQPVRQYITDIQDVLKSHRHCCALRRRAPVKPLVIYCAGGYHNRSINTIECFFPSTQEWKKCSDLQVSRSGTAVVALFMRIYIIGGRKNSKNESKDCAEVERYDPFLNQCMNLPAMIYPRNRLGAGSIDTSIYAVGGSNGQKILASVERFSTLPDAEKWVEVCPMRTARIGLAVCTLNRLLYAIGGFDGHRRLAEVESYDPDTDLWKQEEPLRMGRSGASAASLDQFIFVVGGYASDSVEGPMQLSSVERFDVLSQQWTFIKSMSCPRSALSCIALDNKIFTLGGYDGTNFSSVVEIYDPERNEWTYGTPMTRERSGHGCAITIEPSLDHE